LLIANLVHNRRLTRQAEERLRVLVGANPVAIITADDSLIESANRAAAQLIATFSSRTAQGPQLGGSTQYHARHRNG
jgi:hypothetical protein